VACRRSILIVAPLMLWGCGGGDDTEAPKATTLVSKAASSADTPRLSSPTAQTASGGASSIETIANVASASVAAPVTADAPPAVIPTISLRASMEDMEAIGPFASWRPARSFGAVGDGIADDTAALQRALDELVKTGAPKVLHFQAGTYRITASLRIDATAGTYGLSLIGDDPATTRIVWDGPVGAPMLIANGGLHTNFSRITWDGRSKAGYGVAHWWRADGPLYGGSAEHADEVFVDMEIGIMGGRLGQAYGQLDSEGQIRRVKFIRNTKAGLNVGSFNALNWWVWDSQFTDCGRGVTNKFTVSDTGGEGTGAGSFVVYRSLFERSKVADAEIGNTGTFGIYASTSIGSRRFFHSDRMGLNTARETLQGNRVLDTTDPVAVYNGNLGLLSLIDNEFRSLSGATGPVVRLDNIGVGTDVLSIANRFTVTAPIGPLNGENRVRSIGDRVMEPISIVTRLPVLPVVPARVSRLVFDVARGANGAAIQAAIDSAVAAARAGAINPVVHLPAGDYVLDRTLTVPANARIQIAGDSIGTLIYAALRRDAPMLQLSGPSLVTVRDLRFVGQGQQAIVIDNADQDQGRILVTGSSMGPVAASSLRRTLLSMQANPSILAMELNGVAGALSLGTGGFGPLTLRGDSQFLMSDSWYEGPESRLFRLESGRLTVRNSHIAPADPRHGGGTVEPLIAFDGFRGSTTLLGVELNIQDAGNGIRVGRIGADSQALFLGVQANQLGFFAGETSVGEVGLVLSRERPARERSTTDSMPQTSLSGIGLTSDDFVMDALAQARSVIWEPAPSVAPAGATDVRLYRIMTVDALVGMRVTGESRAP